MDAVFAYIIFLALMAIGIVCGVVVGSVCKKPDGGRRVWIGYGIVALLLLTGIAAQVVLQTPESTGVIVALFFGLGTGWYFIDSKKETNNTQDSAS